jgi:fructose-specific phosphotransferase system IIC component
MEAEQEEQEEQEDIHYEEDTPVGEVEIIVPSGQNEEQEGYVIAEPATEQTGALEGKDSLQNLEATNEGKDRAGFIHGLSVGLGIGCISTFVIMWITVFFSPQLPSTATYEALLSIFIYPLIYLLTVGLIALTAGIVREYFTRSSGY